LKRQGQQLEDAATHDPLTGVANRRSFYQAADMEFKRCRRYASIFTFVYMDIDNFRLVNNLYGQNTGDDLLKQVAIAIQRNTRDIDTVGRLGADEFAVLLPQTSGGGAKQMSTRIQELLTEIVVSHRWPISFSIVVVTFFQPPPSTREMMERADKLMHSIKKSGKNSIAYESWP
jgi:diguanylate cyclase (GGDEF)-like protein